MASYKDPTVNCDKVYGLTKLDNLFGARRVDSHSLLGGSTELMLKQGNALLKEIDEKFGNVKTDYGEPVVRDTTNILRLRGVFRKVLIATRMVSRDTCKITGLMIWK